MPEGRDEVPFCAQNGSEDLGVGEQTLLQAVHERPGTRRQETRDGDVVVDLADPAVELQLGLQGFLGPDFEEVRMAIDDADDLGFREAVVLEKGEHRQRVVHRLGVDFLIDGASGVGREAA